MMAFMAKWFKAGKSGTYDTRGAQSGVILPVPDRRVYRITGSRGKSSEVSVVKVIGDDWSDHRPYGLTLL